MATSNTQTTITTNAALDGGGKSTYLNKQYFDRKMLAHARTKFVFAKFGQKRVIPPNSGKYTEFRRWEIFDPALAVSGLQDGVTPDGQALGQTNVEATLEQFGAYTEISDLLGKTSYDDIFRDTPQLLGEQLGTVLEWVTRDELLSGSNVIYAGGKASRLQIDSTVKLTVADIRKGVRALKKAKARYFNGAEAGGKPGSRKPHFMCVCSPDATYDLQTDNLWQDVSKYSNAEQIYSGEIGRLFGVVFVESTEYVPFKPSVVNKVNADISTAGATFVLKNDPTAAEVKYLSTGGNTIYINGTAKTLADTGSYTAATKTVKLSENEAGFTGGHVVSSADAGAIDTTSKIGIDIHSTLMFGAEAYGVVDLGDGTSSIRSIIKDFGKGGFDPLDQRATIGAKVMAYTAKILNQLWIVRIEHSVSA